MRARLFRVIVPVPDIAAAEHFYATLLAAPGERVSPGRHYFELGGTLLALYDPVADGDELEDGWRFHANQYLYIAVPDLETYHARARAAGAIDLEPIASMPWGERLFYARDPFGQPIAFVDETTLFTGAG